VQVSVASTPWGVEGSATSKVKVFDMLPFVGNLRNSFLFVLTTLRGGRFHRPR
jgi:hypothetical protein